MKKRKRANTTNITETVAAAIKGMVARGDKQMDVAIWAGCNQGRVCEIANGTGYGRHFLHVAPALPEVLPEPGPYRVLSVRRVNELELNAAVVAKLEALIAELKAIT